MKCKCKILDLINSFPITFLEVVKNTNCSADTVNKYINEFVQKGMIKEQKYKHRILYKSDLSQDKIDLYKILLNSTVISLLTLMFNTNRMTQNTASIILGKSHPTVSRAFQVLVMANIVIRTYHAPYMTYKIKKKRN